MEGYTLTTNTLSCNAATGAWSGSATCSSNQEIRLETSGSTLTAVVPENGDAVIAFGSKDSLSLRGLRTTVNNHDSSITKIHTDISSASKIASDGLADLNQKVTTSVAGINAVLADKVDLDDHTEHTGAINGIVSQLSVLDTDVNDIRKRATDASSSIDASATATSSAIRDQLFQERVEAAQASLAELRSKFDAVRRDTPKQTTVADQAQYDLDKIGDAVRRFRNANANRDDDISDLTLATGQSWNVAGGRIPADPVYVETEQDRLLARISTLNSKIASLKNRGLKDYKQCQWYAVNDDRNDGQIFTCSYNKLKDDSILRLTYNGDMRVVNGQCRWYLTINGRECVVPGQLDVRLYDTNSDNNHRVSTITGFCRENAAPILKGNQDIGLWVQGQGGDCYTAWGYGARITIEEYDKSGAQF